MTRTGDTVVRYSGPESGRFELLCVPHAAGGAGRFHPWAAAVGDQAALSAVRLPGRESRVAEPPLRSVDDVIAAIAPALDERTEPLALFGLCSGAVIAYELAHHVVREGRRPLLHFFCAGQVAPALLAADPQPIDDEAVVQTLRRFGGVSEELLADEDYLDVAGPAIVADLEVLATFRHGERPALPCPITALVGTDDDLPEAAVRSWATETSAAFSLTRVPGDHLLDASWGALPGLIAAACRPGLEEVTA
jgi:pyochelin biosynthetic protein PchC